MATSTPTTRRRVLQSFGYFTAAGFTVAVPKTPAAAVPLPRAEPTDKGKRLLGILALYRDAWRQGPLSDEDADAAGAFLDEARDVAREIAAASTHTMSDVVDKAIALGWLLNPCGGFESGDFNDLLAPLLAIGGVTPAMCAEDIGAGA